MSVSLIAMDEDAFYEYLKMAIPSYARSNVDSGRWNESGALERSKESYDELLPQRTETEDNYLFNIIVNVSQDRVGYIWVKIENNINTKSAFIYDIEIYENHRRKGYAKSALKSIEAFVSGHGASSLGLHVFKNNSGAINLYNSVGFQTVSYNMQKQIKENRT